MMFLPWRRHFGACVAKFVAGGGFPALVRVGLSIPPVIGASGGGVGVGRECCGRAGSSVARPYFSGERLRGLNLSKWGQVLWGKIIFEEKKFIAFHPLNKSFPPQI